MTLQDAMDARVMDPEHPDYDPFKADFKNFLWHIATDILGWEPSPVQYDIADWMQDLPLSADGKRRGQVQSMRSEGKTVIACAFVCWLLYVWPDCRIVVVGSTGPKAELIGGLIKKILYASELLAHLRPRPDQKNNETLFDVNGQTTPRKEHSCNVFGLYGTWTGEHPDVILADDIEVPENSYTYGMRRRMQGKVKEFEALIMDGGLVLVQGTPQCEESVYVTLDELGYPLRRWPCYLPDPAVEDDAYSCSPTLLERVRNGEKPGSATDPQRWSEVQLLEQLARVGQVYFDLQMRLNTRLSDEDRHPLKLRNLVVLDTHPDLAPGNVVWGTADPVLVDSPGLGEDRFFRAAWHEDDFRPYQGNVFYIDPSGTGSDKVGYAGVKSLNGLLFCPSAGEMAGGHEQETMQKLANIIHRHGFTQVVVEGNFGDGMWAKLFQPILAKTCGPVAMETPKVSSKVHKEERIISCLAPLTEAHRLVISEDVARQRELWWQYTHITRAKGSLPHEDALDALAGACEKLAPLTAYDPQAQEAKRKEADRKAEARAFVKAWNNSASRLLPGAHNLQPKRRPRRTTSRPKA